MVGVVSGRCGGVMSLLAVGPLLGIAATAPFNYPLHAHYKWNRCSNKAGCRERGAALSLWTWPHDASDQAAVLRFFSRTSTPIPLVSIAHPPKALAAARRSSCSFV